MIDFNEKSHESLVNSNHSDANLYQIEKQMVDVCKNVEKVNEHV